MGKVPLFYLFLITFVFFGNRENIALQPIQSRIDKTNHQLDRSSKERIDYFTSVKSFVSLLSEEQRSVLADFFRLIIGRYFSGYVLFGDKPLCIEAWPLQEEDTILSGFNPRFSLYAKWQDLWQSLGISPENKEYLFINFDMVDNDSHHLICINRKTFIQTVNDNITLFRYVLGPTLTAEHLLDQLIHSKSNFYDVLKNDNVLLGILLGYGQQNALLVSRQELISDAFAKDREEDFPYIARQLRFTHKKLPKIQSKRASIGYECLADEFNTLKKKIVTSIHMKPFKICKLPHFGCDPSSQETQVLLNKYENNRSVILKILEDPCFLEKTLTKLFTTTANEIEIPKISLLQKSFLDLNNQEQMIEKLINKIYQEIKMNAYFHEDYVRSFLEGVKAKQNSIFLESPKNRPQLAINIYQLEQKLNQAKNLDLSNTFFNSLEPQNGIIAVVPKKLCYKIIRKGEGRRLSINNQNASFHYFYKILCGSIIAEDVGTVKEESLEFFIPGISLSLIGMRIGEIREVYIHPEYGYGENTYLPPNVTIVAKIELLNFLDSANEITITPSHHIIQENYKELLGKYKISCCDEFYWQGVHFWNEMQKTKRVDFDIFIKKFIRICQAQ